ncbi:MAG: hypothetical protein PF485_15295 [Bacteroidales bacterium]|jgi:magnesium-transporting ATPase (P-type)|nr:hypothetical protein [Bacteroidales bacterium]
MENKQSPQGKKDIRSYLISYFSLRKAVGFLGVSLPVILVLGSIALDGETKILNSISTYYHTRIGNALVGILCAFALFLFSYRGHDYKDNIAGHLAGLFALGIAFLPNSPNDPTTLINRLHLSSAILFFAVLIYFSIFLFTKSDKPKPYPRPKRNRNMVYYICGFTMLGSILLIAAYMIWIKNKVPCIDNLEPVFWLETLALLAFGISWLTKGQAVFKDTDIAQN